MIRIAFCGMDGSGKTTAISYIKKKLDRRGYKTKIYYPFNYIILNRFLKPIRLRNKNGLLKKNKNALFKFWPILVIFDNLIQNIYISLIFRNYDFVFFDRYYYDLATSFQELGYTFGLLYNLYLKSVKRSNITIIILSDPEVALKKERGGSHNIEFFKRQKQRYEKIASEFNFKIFYNDYSHKTLRNIENYINKWQDTQLNTRQ